LWGFVGVVRFFCMDINRQTGQEEDDGSGGNGNMNKAPGTIIPIA
jgi:hypothetical protein